MIILTIVVCAVSSVCMRIYKKKNHNETVYDYRENPEVLDEFNR